MQTFKGKSENGAPIIGAKWWKKGKSITGVITGIFQTQVGECYNVSLKEEIEVPGEMLSPPQKGKLKGLDWSLGALKGFEMAIRAANCDGLRKKDFFTLTCTGVSETRKGNPRVDFELEVRRDSF